MVRSLMSIVLAVVCAGGLLAPVTAVNAGNAIRQLSLDDSAPVVELFDGVESGQLQVRMLAKSAQEANVFIKNAGDAPLTVKLPKAAVGVHILPQFNQFGANQFGNPLGGNPFGNQLGNQIGNQIGNQFGNQAGNGLGNVLNQGIGNGQAQTIGGGMQPLGNQGFPNLMQNGLNQGLNGNGQFSIPPEKTVQLKMRTVCLNFGHPDPHVGLKYELRKLETVTTNPALCALLENFSPRVDQDAMQAAAWHLANGLSWKQLSNLPDSGTLGLSTVFNAQTLTTAQRLVEHAQAAAKDRERPPEKLPATTPKAATRASRTK